MPTSSVGVINKLGGRRGVTLIEMMIVVTLLAVAAGLTYPSVTGGVVARRSEDLVHWWDALTRNRANLMTVHLTSTVRMGEDRRATAADSFGRVWGFENLRVNDASLLPDAPGVNPQAAIMTIAARNTDHFLAV